MQTWENKVTAPCRTGAPGPLGGVAAPEVPLGPGWCEVRTWSEPGRWAQTEVGSWLHHPPFTQPWESGLAFLCLRFLLYKLGVLLIT